MFTRVFKKCIFVFFKGLGARKAMCSSVFLNGFFKNFFQISEMFVCFNTVKRKKKIHFHCNWFMFTNMTSQSGQHFPGKLLTFHAMFRREMTCHKSLTKTITMHLQHGDMICLCWIVVVYTACMHPSNFWIK